MKKLIYPTLFVTLLCGIQCKTIQYTPEDYPKSIISFGTGGGFSGIVTEYFLLENGQFFKMSSHKDGYEKAANVDAQRTEQIFQNYRFLDIENMEFNHPSNFYYFITHKEGNHEHQIVWGDAANPIAPQIKTYYRNLTQLIKESGFRPEPSVERE